MALLKDLWNFDQTKSPALFYNKFKDLNSFYNISEASPNILKNLQIQTLKSAYNNKQAGYETLNSFLRQMLGSKQGTEEDLFAKLVQGINEGLDQFRRGENKINPNWNREEYYKKLDNIVLQINSLVDQITGEKGIPAPSLDAIKYAVGHHQYNDFIQEKGKYLEEIGTWIVNRAGLTGFQTGAWQAVDRFFGEDAQASIIEDVMALLLNGKEELNGASDNFLQLKIKGYNNASRREKRRLDRELQEWIDSIKELNGLSVLNGVVTIGSNISSSQEFINLISLINDNSSANSNLSIVLSDNLYQEIQKLSVNIQAKSNINRHLANEGNRSLFQMSPNDKYYSQLLSFSLTKPVVKGTSVTQEEQNTPYEEFAAYVNYNLSKNIDKTVYGRNEFYITVEGFADLATLMEKRGFYIRIQNSALSYLQFLNNSFSTIYS